MLHVSQRFLINFKELWYRYTLNQKNARAEPQRAEAHMESIKDVCDWLQLTTVERWSGPLLCFYFSWVFGSSPSSMVSLFYHSFFLLFFIYLSIYPIWEWVTSIVSGPYPQPPKRSLSTSIAILQLWFQSWFWLIGRLQICAFFSAHWEREWIINFYICINAFSKQRLLLSLLLFKLFGLDVLCM